MTDDQSPKRKTLGLKPTRTDSAQAAPRKAGATRPVRISDLNRQRVRDVAEGIKRARAAQDAAKPRKPADAAAKAGGERPRRFDDAQPRREGDARPRRFSDDPARGRAGGDGRRFGDGERQARPRRFGDDDAGARPQGEWRRPAPGARRGDDSRDARGAGDARGPRPRRFGDDDGNARPQGEWRRPAPGARRGDDNRDPRGAGDARGPRPRRFGDDDGNARPQGEWRRPAPGARRGDDNRDTRGAGDARGPRPRRFGDDDGNARPQGEWRRPAPGARRGDDNRDARGAGDARGPRPRRFDDDGSARPQGEWRRPAPGARRAGDAPARPRDAAGDVRARRFSDTADRTKPARALPAERQEAPEPAAADGLVRLSKRMSELGLCSRREADEWIPRGWVLVDGEAITELGSRVRPDAEIEILQAARSEQGERVTVLLHKPVGYVSGQAEDGYEPAAVLFAEENHWQDDPTRKRFAPWQRKNLAPAGRLDIDSTGLLVLTQDGRVARQLIGEDSTIEKEYLVRVVWHAPQGRVERNVADVFPAESLDKLRHGLSLDGVELKPAKVSWQNEEQLRFVLREGRKRQIRRMCEQVGLEVVGLKRVRMGRIVLGDLPVGQWRFLGPFEKF
ncbi:16S rRNA pseudouridylate synthase [Cupriavidus sp. USMAA2-4]|uniref:pseudouridine synthase n=1 Tax=Cupriavidus sp. USMAA2-4 TaxID=876364 RepID=UPI0008A6C753|nr:pseudouridine synthase [Cupriavidus sp. USMAA2-4]AOY90916.1 16S rRNA pseudouridylate synthase [Cupriavidus sp. USMAA2-4]